MSSPYTVTWNPFLAQVTKRFYHKIKIKKIMHLSKCVAYIYLIYDNTINDKFGPAIANAN